MKELSRRQLLRLGAGGTALVTMPRFLAACAPKGSPMEALASPADPFMAWFGIDRAMIARVMAELTANGADHADLYFQHARSTSIRSEDGVIGAASTSIDQGVGLRVVIGDQTGYAYTEALTFEAMRDAARTAAAIARGQAVVPPVDFTHKAMAGYYEIGVPWSDIGIADKLPLIARVDALARAGDPSIARVDVSWSDDEERVLIADLAGNLVTDYRPMTRLWCTVTATRGDETRSNSANIAARQGFDWYTDERLATMVQKALDRTLILFDARRPPAGELPVVLASGASGILLHEAIGHGMEADFNRKGTSIYADKVGKVVAPPFVTIYDDGTVPYERGALNVDDEGNATQRTDLVKDGVLASYLHDRISARHYGVAPTGSGRRQSFRYPPMPRMRCTAMDDGPHTRDEIIASIDKGIIAETYTNGQVQIGAGDFTFYVKNGWMIENGRVTAPIKDCNIIGNGPEILERVTMVANDGHLDTGGWTCGKDGQRVPVSQGMPTVLVSRITVGGDSAG